MESAQNLGTEKPPPLLASDGVRIFEKETTLSSSPAASFRPVWFLEASRN
jgi:hypothetical protein